MSQCTFIAADVPLKEIRDRYTRALSLREAVKAGVMSGQAARGAGIGANEPGVVISCVLRPGEDPADNFSLLEFPFARRYCGMGCAPPRIKERRVSVSDFTGADVEEIYSSSCWPADDIINLCGGERPTYHRLRVERRAV